MKHQSNILPEPMQMPVRNALTLNAWAGVAVLAAFVSRLLLKNSPELDGMPRVLLALLPLLPGLLYVRALWRWMLRQDELQRRLQLEAVCFGALGMLLVALLTDLLRAAGYGRWLSFGWEGYFALTFFLYSVGLVRANRGVR